MRSPRPSPQSDACILLRPSDSCNVIGMHPGVRGSVSYAHACMHVACPWAESRGCSSTHARTSVRCAPSYKCAGARVCMRAGLQVWRCGDIAPRLVSEMVRSARGGAVSVVAPRSKLCRGHAVKDVRAGGARRAACGGSRSSVTCDGECGGESGGQCGGERASEDQRERREGVGEAWNWQCEASAGRPRFEQMAMDAHAPRCSQQHPDVCAVRVCGVCVFVRHVCHVCLCGQRRVGP